MGQTWDDLLFGHYRAPVDELRKLVPDGLEIQEHSGSSWLGVTPFAVTGLRARGLPAFPYVSSFLELNVRTYVTRDGKPGVWFFSLDAGNPLAAYLARQLYHLPYHAARMACVPGGRTISYRCERPGGGAAPQAEFLGDYGPNGDAFLTPAGSLEEWLTARYCLYAERAGTLYRAEIDHVPWTLHRGAAEIRRNTMADASGITLPPDRPLLHYAAPLEVRIWWPERIDGAVHQAG